MFVYTVWQGGVDEDVLISVFSSYELAERCVTLGQMVGLERWVARYPVRNIYTGRNDLAVEMELRESGTRCDGYKDGVFIFEDL